MQILNLQRPELRGWDVACLTRGRVSVSYSTVQYTVQLLSILKLNKNFNNKTKLFNKQTGSLKCCLGALGLVNKQFFLRRKWKINPTNIYFVDH